MKKETEYIIRLIVKRLRGELSPEEETFFMAWKARSKANEELYERLENEYEEYTEYPLYEQLPFVSNNGETLIYHTPRMADSLVYNTLKIPRGGAYSLQLSDGTKVMLNSDSRLKFPQSFSGDTREVYLEGEGFFQVAKDTAKPFIVHCEEYAVRVLGTTFNISAYRNDEVSMTTLVEGRVNIECGNTVVALTPGLMATVADSKVTTREVNVESYISWTKDQFSFSEERLEDLLKKISRWYDVEFVFDDEEIRDYKFSGFMPRYESITNLFEILEQSANVSFIRKNDKKVIIIML